MSNVIDEFGNATTLNIKSDTGELKVSSARDKIDSRSQLFFPCDTSDINNIGVYNKSIFDAGTTVPQSTQVNPNKWRYYPTGLQDSIYIDVNKLDPNASHFSVAINCNRDVANNPYPKIAAVVIGNDRLPTGSLPTKFTADYYNTGSIINEAFQDSRSLDGTMDDGAILVAVAQSGGEDTPTGLLDGSGPRIWKIATSLIPINYQYYTIGIINFGTSDVLVRSIFSVVS